MKDYLVIYSFLEKSADINSEISEIKSEYDINEGNIDEKNAT